MTPSNTLPVIIFRGTHSSQPKIAAGLSQIIGLFSTDMILPDPNESLTPFMVAESTAFISLLQSRFAPARLHEVFRLDRNYADIYHTLLEKERKFPLNRILPYLRRKEILQSLSGKLPNSLYFDSNIALTALSTRLGNRKFFYSNPSLSDDDNIIPSVLDAVVFGYLASVLYTPLAVSTLRDQISKFKNLIDFTNRITDLYFKHDRINLLEHGTTSVGIGDDVRKRAEEIKDKAHGMAAERARRATEGSPGEDVEGLSEEERERKKWNGYFLWGSVAIFATHLLIGSEIELDIS